MEKLVASNKCFYSFCLKPPLKFESQFDGEETLLVLRSHPFTQIFWLINVFIMLLILFFVNMVLPLIFDLNQIIIITIFCIVFILSYSFFNLINWYFNVGIITNKRVIDIDYYYVLYKEITVAYLNKIQDVTVKSGGFFDSIFDYGDIFIQTAGTDPNIEFLNIPKPNKVREIICQLSN